MSNWHMNAGRGVRDLSTAAQSGPIRRVIARAGYGSVLGLIICSILLAGMGDDPVVLIARLLVQYLVLVVALWAANVSLRTFMSTAGVATFAVIAAIIATLSGTSISQIVGSPLDAQYSSAVLAIGLTIITPVALVIGVEKEGKVTFDTVLGAIAFYLIIGLLFAQVYAITQVTTGTFFAQGRGDGTDFIYFSFITLTTTGYGDLTPGPSLARMMAVTEALIGQVYLVTIVALLVSNLGRTRPDRQLAQADEE
jgi:hypothetical protein